MGQGRCSQGWAHALHKEPSICWIPILPVSPTQLETAGRSHLCIDRWGQKTNWKQKCVCNWPLSKGGRRDYTYWQFAFLRTWNFLRDEKSVLLHFIHNKIKTILFAYIKAQPDCAYICVILVGFFIWGLHWCPGHVLGIDPGNAWWMLLGVLRGPVGAGDQAQGFVFKTYTL